MKKQFIIAIVAMSLVVSVYLPTSCQKPDNLSPEERSLNLTAPSGVSVATNFTNLKAEVARVLSDKLGSSLPFTITAMNYLNLSKGYAVKISYKTEDGEEGAIAFVHGHKVNGMNELNANENEFARQIVLVCSGTCQCSASLQYDTSTQTITYSCGCSTCYAHIYII